MDLHCCLKLAYLLAELNTLNLKEVLLNVKHGMYFCLWHALVY